MAAHRWWEVDINGYIIHGLERLGLVWDVVRVPAALRSGEAAAVASLAPAGAAWRESPSIAAESPKADALANQPAQEISSR